MAKVKPTTLKAADQQQPLGNLIAAVLAHPDTPEKVYDCIVDGLNELQTRDVSRRSQFIQAVIDGHNELERTELDLTLVSCGNNKIETIKTVKEFTGRSLQEAKDMVDGVPSILKKGVNKEEAEAIKKKLEKQGCRVGHIDVWRCSMKTKKVRLVAHTIGNRTRGPIDERVSKALKGDEEPWEVYGAAQACIDEYRDHFMKAVELIIKESEVSPGKWSFVQTLFLSLRVNPLRFEVAIKDATYTNC